METERLIFLVLAITGGCFTAPQGQRPSQLWPQDRPWNMLDGDPNQLGGEERNHEAIVELAKFVWEYLARDVEKNRQLILDNQAVLQKIAVNNPVASLEVQRSETTANAPKLLFPKSKFFKKVQTRVLDYDEDLSLDPLPNYSDPNVIPSHDQLGQETPSDYQDMGSESLSLPLDPLGGTGNRNLLPQLERYPEDHDLDPVFFPGLDPLAEIVHQNPQSRLESHFEEPELGSGGSLFAPNPEEFAKKVPGKGSDANKILDNEAEPETLPEFGSGELEPESETEAEPELELGPGLESHSEEPELESGGLLLEVPRRSIFATDPLPGWDDPNLL